MIEIISNEAFERARLILHAIPDGAQEALKNVISQATATARKKTLEGITSVYDIKAKDVRDRKNTTINMKTQKTAGGIVGYITFNGNRIPLYRFGVSPKAPQVQGRKMPVKFENGWAMVAPGVPVRARVKKSEPMSKFHSAFIAVMKNGHTGMFEKKGFDRGPIREFMGASTAEMAGNSIVLKEVEDAVVENLADDMEQEISRILHSYGGK